eukprot:757554-Hanusia_phi.AAC.2
MTRTHLSLSRPPGPPPPGPRLSLSGRRRAMPVRHGPGRPGRAGPAVTARAGRRRLELQQRSINR